MNNKFDDTLKTITNFSNQAQSVRNAGNRALNAGSSFVNTFGLGSIVSAAMPTATTPVTTGQPMQAQSAIIGNTGVASASVLESPIQDIGGKKYYSTTAPIGTRLIIPKEISSTGQERYLGAHALESIMNLMQGNEKCGNIVVLGKDGMPSALFYQRTEDGSTVLKANQKPVNICSKGSNASICLSEEEFAAIREALTTKTNDVTYFKTSKERGDAEDSTAEKGSWFSRNWWKILLGLVIAGGIAWGGIEILNRRKEKKEEKRLAATTPSSQTENGNQNTSNNSQALQTASAQQQTGTGLSGTNITNEQTPIINTNSNSGNSL